MDELKRLWGKRKARGASKQPKLRSGEVTVKTLMEELGSPAGSVVSKLRRIGVKPSRPGSTSCASVYKRSDIIAAIKAYVGDDS